VGAGWRWQEVVPAVRMAAYARFWRTRGSWVRRTALQPPSCRADRAGDM